MEKYKVENGIKYGLGENGVYYPIFEVDEFKVGKYSKMAMEHMKSINKARYNMLGILQKLPEIFNGLDDKVYSRIDEIMEKKLKDESVQQNWNLIEMEAHKKMLYREAEEIALKELVYIDHFKNIDMDKILKEN